MSLLANKLRVPLSLFFFVFPVTGISRTEGKVMSGVLGPEIGVGGSRSMLPPDTERSNASRGWALFELCNVDPSQ